MSQSPKKHAHRRTNSALISPMFAASPSTPIRAQVYSHIWDTPDPTAHVSPTKAAAQSRLNHEVVTITAWLEGLFGGTIPAHLRGWRDEIYSSGLDGGLIGNDDFGTPGKGPRGEGVLDALKAIKQVNVAGDHLSGLLAEAKGEEVARLEEQNDTRKRQRDEDAQGRVLLDQALNGLSTSGEVALDELVVAAVVIGIDQRDVEECAEGGLQGLFLKRTLYEANTRMILREQVEQLRVMERNSRAREEYGDVQMHGDDQSDDEANSLAMQTSQFARDGKQVNLKIMEYEDRLRGLERQLAQLRSESTSFQDVVDARARVDARKARVKGLQQRFAAFHGLPADLDASRSEVKRAMSELDAVKSKREALFERIGHVQ